MGSWSSLRLVVVMIAAVGPSAVADAKGQVRLAAVAEAQAQIGPAATAQIGSVRGHSQTSKPASVSDQAGSSLIEATRELKSDSENLIQLQEAELAEATEKLQQLRTLVAEGLVAKNELQQSEEEFSTIQKTLETTRQQIVDADRTIADILASEQLAKSQAAAAKLLAKSRSFVTPTILRYNGPTNWPLANLVEIQGFFSSKFGRSLPMSAVGQSSTHKQLGFDHRHAVDVAVHPDSMEGKALISYLQRQGIPFLAFRAAVAGVATGPHIHIGPPSHRFV